MDLFETGAKTFPKKLLTPYLEYFFLMTYLNTEAQQGGHIRDSCSNFSNLQLVFSWVEQTIASNPRFWNTIYAFKASLSFSMVFIVLNMSRVMICDGSGFDDDL